MTANPFDSMPYDNMVGIWIGTFAIFDTAGDCVTAGPSRYMVYWKDRPNLMHFRQDQDLQATVVKSLIERVEDPALKRLLQVDDAAAQVVEDLAAPDYDLIVTGKSAEGVGMGPAGRPVEATGAELSPDVYHFQLVEKGSKAQFRWYNTHIFPSQDERRTIGPVIDMTGRIGLIMLHTYTRISRTVPETLFTTLGEKLSHRS
ncbi:hypothetical protein IVB02_09155 [Bradyrhizobium sp. 166]|uniref:hypothetical protein n=1 Tax=Bradyrhizobium sp. 166 TaxID=2782638 RepID=UPI001FF803EB|nr:hypothetical protein [Bradyrhizobium sp. 166]MCK1601598.1 hypothetical protein [Bradyrhizobium sp. 166]